MIYVKQHQSSPLSTMEVKRYVQDIANQRFSDTQGQTGSGSIKLKEKVIYYCLVSPIANFLELRVFIF